MQLGSRTWIMGIVNTTSDSFSGDGVLSRYRKDKIPGLSYALKLIDDGADILDIGGESTRPGAVAVPVQEETLRVVPLVKALAGRVKVPLSVDTYKPMVARAALDAGASIVNLIKGTPPSKAMLKVVKDHGAGLVLMHMRGSPKNMQSRTEYANVVSDVSTSLRDSLKDCLAYGIRKTNIVIDPGICFSKTCEQNLLLLKHLERFLRFGVPVLVGTSRKSFIGKVLNAVVKDRLTGTIATAVMSAASGAHILRVHDVKQIKKALDMTDAIIKAA